MNSRKTLLVCSITLFMVLLVPRVPAQTGETETAETSREMASYFPDSTVALGIIPDVPALKNKLTSHRLAEAFENEQVREFFRPMLKNKKLNLTKEKLKEITGQSLDQLTEMMTGPAVIGLMEGKKGLFINNQGNNQSDSPGNVKGLFIGKVGSHSDTLANSVIPSLIEKGKEKMKEKGNAELYEKTESMGNQTLHTLIKQSQDDTQTIGSWTFVDGYFVVVGPESQTLLKKTVRKLKGGAGGSSVAENQNFGKATQKAKNAEMFVFVDVQKIVEAGYEHAREQQDGGKKKRGPSPEEVMNALGLDTFRSVVGTLNLEDSFTELSAEMSYTGRKGLTQILAFKSLPRNRQELLSLPPSTVTASATGFSIKQFWERALNTFKQLSPQMSGILNMQLNQLKKKYGIDLKQDVVNSLGNRIIMANFGPPEKSGSKNKKKMSSRQMWAISIRDKQRLIGAINSLKDAAGQGKEYFSEREYLGTTVYSVKPALMPGSGSGNTNPAYAFVDGYLLMSPNVEPIEDTIAHSQRGNRNGFFEQDDVQKALDRLPAEPSSFSYTNLKNVTSFLMNQLKSGVGAGALGAGPGGNSIEDYVNLDAKLSPETIGKFVQSVVAALHMNDQRSRMTWRLQHEKQE